MKNDDDDDDNGHVIESVWEKVKDEISRDDFDRIVQRAKGRKVINLAAYIMKSVQTHIVNQGTAAASDFKPQRQRRKSPKDLPLVEDTGPAPEMSEDQIRHMYELARKLKERGQEQ